MVEEYRAVGFTLSVDEQFGRWRTSWVKAERSARWWLRNGDYESVWVETRSTGERKRVEMVNCDHVD